MKSSHGLLSRRRGRTDAQQRAGWLRAFDGSGLSAAAFAREHSLSYKTVCRWLQQRAKAAPAFVELELPASSAPGEVVIEWGAHLRVRVRSAEQVELVAHLLQALEDPKAC